MKTTLALIAVLLLANCVAVEYMPGEKTAEELYNLGIGQPWRGGDPPAPRAIAMPEYWQEHSSTFVNYEDEMNSAYYPYPLGGNYQSYPSQFYFQDLWYRIPSTTIPPSSNLITPPSMYPSDSTFYYPSSTASLVDHSMTRGIAPSGEPLGRTSTFYVNDTVAYSWVQFGPLYEDHRINWKWYSPNNVLYVESNGVIPHPRSRGLEHWFSPRYWSELFIAGKPAGRMPGLWRVEVYLDGQLVLNEPFAITQ